jgi:hypothetical protein
MASLALPFAPLCPVCNKPVDLRNCNTDSDGRAVHEDCYFFRVHSISNPSSSARAARSNPRT